MSDFLRKNSVKTFLIAFFLACAIYIPFMVITRGYLFYFGDFNVQQVPFYKLAHEAIRSGDIFWSWKTDLGANFIGAYSFYLLFSPFFWLTLPFPTEFVPHLIGPLLILKTACAALTSFYYLKRFVKDARYATLGAIIYAFSGYTNYNIFYNHFHEVIIFFPLLLIALEELVINGRRGWFVLAVAINCLVNYWFFIGEVVFVIIYFFVRCSCGDWPINLRKFFALAVESVIGLLMSMFLLLPSVLAITSNPRVAGDNLISGWLMWIYGFSQRLPAIWASFFFPPELPSQPNFFPEMGANWSSVSAYLPLFSTCGVIAFLFAKRRHFIKRMILISALMASVPVLNSAFILFNISYYARWFYMPTLLMSAATIIMLEDFDREQFMRGVKWTLFITLFIGVAVGLTPIKKEEEMTIGLSKYPERFWAYFAVASAGLLIVWVLVKFFRDKPGFLKLTTYATGLFGVGTAVALIGMGNYFCAPNADWIIDTALDGRYELSLPDDEFARADIYKGMDNLGMYWGLPNIQAFHSIVPGSIMEFYPAIGVKRDVSSKPDTEYVELRALLSVRWFFMDERDTDVPMPGFSLYDKQLGYNIYENDNYLPMGFGYDSIYGEEVFNELSKIENTREMLDSLYLDAEAIERNQDIVSYITDVDYFRLRTVELWELTANRRDLACDTFEIDNHGFTATSNLDRDVLMFFSVPYDKGWSATVNGEPVIVEKANIGFMAVRVPAGEAVIRFDYVTPGLKTGSMIALSGLLLYCAYLLIAKKARPLSEPLFKMRAKAEISGAIDGQTGDIPSDINPFEGEAEDTGLYAATEIPQAGEADAEEADIGENSGLPREEN